MLFCRTSVKSVHGGLRRAWGQCSQSSCLPGALGPFVREGARCSRREEVEEGGVLVRQIVRVWWVWEGEGRGPCYEKISHVISRARGGKRDERGVRRLILR